MKEKFERVIRIAEFGAERLENRRQYEFKIFISYVTLLALGIYKSDKVDCSFFVLILLLSIHVLYISWLIRVSVANRNDGFRRDFYLKKAEDILYSPYNRIYSEYDRGNNPEKPIIKRVPKIWQLWKGGDEILNNWSIGFAVCFPSLMLAFLVLELSCGECVIADYVIKDWIIALIIPTLPILVFVLPTVF